MKKVYYVIATAFLCGCGGGGSDGPTTASSAVPVQTQATQQEPSNKFADNTVDSNTEFYQFQDYIASIPDRMTEFKSNEVYLKLYTQDGNSLYLGRYSTALDLRVHVPNHIKTVNIDIFSSDPTDPVISEELAL